MSLTRFMVVRHGETVWNAAGRMQGHLDSPLNEEGLAQAHLVAERLAGEPFDHLYCSDLGRALQTAQPLADASGKNIVIDQQLRERGLGIFQGLTSAQCEAAHPEHYLPYHRREPEFQILGGESISQLYRRVTGVFDALARRHSGERLVVVTHGGVLDALCRHVRGMPLQQPRDFSIYNASLNWLNHDGESWSMERWGDISHLTRDAALDDF